LTKEKVKEVMVDKVTSVIIKITKHFMVTVKPQNSKPIRNNRSPGLWHT